MHDVPGGLRLPLSAGPAHSAPEMGTTGTQGGQTIVGWTRQSNYTVYVLLSVTHVKKCAPYLSRMSV